MNSKDRKTEGDIAAKAVLELASIIFDRDAATIDKISQRLSEYSDGENTFLDYYPIEIGKNINEMSTNLATAQASAYDRASLNSSNQKNVESKWWKYQIPSEIYDGLAEINQNSKRMERKLSRKEPLNRNSIEENQSRLIDQGNNLRLLIEQKKSQLQAERGKNNLSKTFSRNATAKWKDFSDNMSRAWSRISPTSSLTTGNPNKNNFDDTYGNKTSQRLKIATSNVPELSGTSDAWQENLSYDSASIASPMGNIVITGPPIDERNQKFRSVSLL
ncbi:uncharacterized protein L201_000141 [Kwoniella dendrophila CBS 6074]|uniref:Uncharacterized protein n=1 Tax=Kwoniella dendrophila CBS 6074 TaxID=1295534 RepID=A0AAX4JK70_9TREE